MKRLRISSRWMIGAAVAGCLVLGGVAGAQAQETNWYVGGSVPLMFIDDSETDTTGSYTATAQVQGSPVQVESDYSAKVESEHDTGFKLGGSVGYIFGNGIRVEGELFYARAKVSKLTHGSISASSALGDIEIEEELAIPVSGSVDQLGGMVNVFYDFEIGEAVTPYVGGGIGLVRIDQSDLNYDTGAVVGALSCEGAYLQAAAAAAAQNQQPPPRETVCANLPEIDTPEPSGTDTVFAWQLGAGFGYDITDSVTLQLGYRLQSVDGLTFTGMNDVASIRAETDLLIHFLEVGVRHRF